ncbi:hypothetical protein MLD38_038303 [Melastoma candidum]|uniref:Uncharacterized protein n=1 Tax=Melastoma candidum TaxID=119954 RepID=A0ACB9KYR7_9MYRT|nr:hypothetical protein MLD38_038303 [Melastoma candidum]
MRSHHPSPHRHHEEPIPQSPRHVAQAVVLSLSATLSQWARKATQAVAIRKMTAKDHCEWSSSSGGSPGSPSKKVRRPTKRLLSNISSKAMGLVTHGRKGQGKGTWNGEEEDHKHEEFEFDFGKGGVWQRTILMGDKCQPLNFAGVIYYDENGKQLDHVPLRSPRASPLPGYLARRDDSQVRA